MAYQKPDSEPEQAGARFNVVRVVPRLAPLKLTALIAFAQALALPVAADAPLTVEIVTATTIAESQSYSLTGEITARNTLNASFPVGGRVADVFVDEGDAVAKGTPLAKIESIQQEQALRAAQAGVLTAQANHRQAREDLTRQDALLERGATTRINRDNAADAERIAEGQLIRARSDLERASKALTDTMLLAPAATVVIDRTVEPGQVVGAAQTVLELALGDGFDAVFNVSEVLMTVPRPKLGIDLELIEHPGQHFEGEAREISPLVDAQTGTVATKVTVINPPSYLSYGDAVRGTASFEVKQQINLPFTTMTATADGPAVWVVDPETMMVSLKQVTVDRFETGRIILAGGLEEGTLVVAKGAQLLYPGRVVQRAEAGQ
ncbi:efflux RND transporter periplasmic adaptor subunit [Lentibacter algarum]|uniref:efflux RND transporter periplasmic adaptor subunit n=1 Tax=Lentibacter algarum TaxID=576131 RepID=UPI001C066E17|nr:efflux RND transporter periplasmic adaptor subunit [Lentibacter algarum]MBU2980410.1 efflux RND transporter periplasmic adaptor subunit [Lentibacter algarum]